MASKFRNRKLKECSKEQLIFMLQNYESALYIISEICVSESKCHIESEKAVDKIRGQLGIIHDIDYIDLQENLNHLMKKEK